MARPDGPSAWWLAAFVALAALGCEQEPPSVRLVRVAPEADPGCGAPGGARTLQVRALGEFPASETTVRTIGADDDAVSLDGFPAALAGLEVEVLDAGGNRLAIGRTAPFVPTALEDGEVAIFTAPPRGACPTGPPAAARTGALVARLGDGALIVGGRDGDGAAVDLNERYDPTRGAFDALPGETYGSGLDAGLVGASLTTLVDGRVVLAGGAATAYQLVDPSAAIAAPAFLREARAFHAALALPDGRLFLAGGCAQVVAGACAPGTALRSTSILDVDRGELVAGPPLDIERIGGVALLDGDGRVLVSGGTAADGAPLAGAERLDLTRAAASEPVADTAGVAVRLASGAVLSAFAPAGATASGGAAILPPMGLAASALTAAPARAGASLIALEDGGALAVGGEPLWFAPYAGRFVAGEGDALPDGAAAARLDDGSVLVLGGERDGEVVAEASIVRPELTGPLTPGAIVTFADDEAARLVVPSDPARVTRVAAAAGAAAHVVLAPGDGDADGWITVAGPRTARPRLAVRMVAAGGARVLVGFVDEAHHHAVTLAPGAPVEVVATTPDGASPVAGCRGDVLEADALAGGPDAPAHAVAVVADGHDLTVAIDDDEVLRCAVELASGQVGVGPLGDELRVDLIDLAR